MKPSTITIFSVALMLMGATSSCKGEPGVAGGATNQSEIAKGKNESKENRMKITVGQKTFSATLENNETVNAFKAMLPLSLDMTDFNSNEKVIRLPNRLPTNDANPKRIQVGDLMIWSSNSLVIFYKSFPTNYSYTKLGRIDNPEGLAAAVGSGNVTIKFELE